MILSELVFESIDPYEAPEPVDGDNIEIYKERKV